MNGRNQERPQPSRWEVWVSERWPQVLIFAGLILFWAACLASDHLPVDALFFGPGLMMGGLILDASHRRHCPTPNQGRSEAALSRVQASKGNRPG
jgi:hypothetical protein